VPGQLVRKRRSLNWLNSKGKIEEKSGNLEFRRQKRAGGSAQKVELREQLPSCERSFTNYSLSSTRNVLLIQRNTSGAAKK
jgi:hypothetical protein